MPLRLLMSDARSRCQQLADMVTDLSITTAEWNARISEKYGELWSIVGDSGEMYFGSLLTITTTGALSYQEPADMYETTSVCRVLDPVRGTRQELQRAEIQERSKLSGLTGDAYKYMLIDDQLFLYPTPPTGQTYEWLYTPMPTDLTTFSDTSVIDVVDPDGLQFLLHAVAAVAVSKSERDPTFFIDQQEAARQRLQKQADDRIQTTAHKRQLVGGSWDLYDEDRVGDDADWSNR